jgi:hypothetical protein
MSLDTQHIALANRNQSVLEYLLQDVGRCTEWVATVAFYKALHLVEAVFANDPEIRHTYKHEARLDALKMYRRYQGVHRPFRVLWAASTVARYLVDQSQPPNAARAYTCFSDYLPADEIQAKLLDHFLVPFEHQAVQLLSEPAQEALVRYRAEPDG